MASLHTELLVSSCAIAGNLVASTRVQQASSHEHSLTPAAKVWGCSQVECGRASVGISGGSVTTRCISARAPSLEEPAVVTEAAVVAAEEDGVQGTPLSPSWPEFCTAVSGEWDGYSADFSPSGQPVELPETVVPSAFKEWEMKLYDWQTQGPTLGRPFGRLLVKTVKLIPTVGCEADAATQHSIEEREAGVGTDAGQLMYATNGSYIVAWPGESVTTQSLGHSTAARVIRRRAKGSPRWELEHCLVGELAREGKFRVKVVQRFEGEFGSGGPPRLLGLTVYRQRWEGEFCNGESIGGCSSTVAPFAEGTAVGRDALGGSWKGRRFSSRGAACQGPCGPLGTAVELTAAAQEDVERRNLDEPGVVRLPSGIWSLVAASDTSFTAQAGWLVDGATALVSSCTYTPAGDLLESYISKEKRT